MLSFYELYDLHSIFVSIRFSPDNEINNKVLMSVLSVLKNRQDTHELNQFRAALQPIALLDKEGLYKFSLVETPIVISHYHF